MNYKYLLDANVFSNKTISSSIDTEFFRNNCIVLEEIGYELLDATIYDVVKQISVPIDGRVLSYLAGIVDEMVQLGIIKTDEGNGEAILVAWGLMILDGPNDQPTFDFLKVHPVIVTNETKVVQYANAKGMDGMQGKAFAGLLESINE